MDDKRNFIDYRLGLDIGIASVGWAVIETDGEGEPVAIAALGVRAFDAAEASDGSSAAVPRRGARGVRRRLRRRKHRLERAKNYLTPLIKDKTDSGADVYELRAAALDAKITDAEFFRVLMWFTKHRGFKSNRKAEAAEKESGDVLKAIKINDGIISGKGYRTAGEMFYKDNKFFVTETKTGENGKKTEVIKRLTRNHGNYDKVISRKQLNEEIKILFAAQRKFGGGKFVSEETEKEFLEIFNSQRGFDEGPAMPSRYNIGERGYDVGKCEFEPGAERAPRASFSFEYFRLLQTVNHIELKRGGKSEPLSAEQKKEAVKYALEHEKITYKQLRKKLEIPYDTAFNMLTYTVKNKKNKKDVGKESEAVLTQEQLIDATEDKAKFSEIKGSYGICKALSLNLSTDKDITRIIDAAALVLSKFKSDDRRRETIAADRVLKDLSEQQIEGLLTLSFEKFGHLSFKALNKIIPELEKGLRYDKACAAAGYNHSAHNYERNELLNTPDVYEAIREITAPVVRRAVSQTVKVINAVVRNYGSPSAVNIELAREMSRTYEERRQIENDNKERAADNERIVKRLKEDFKIAAPKGHDIVKYRLYEEQGGKCAYGLKPFDIERVFSDPQYTQVDHVIPYSRSFNDGYANKVLVLSDENQKKGDRLPYEYFGNDAERWGNFVAFVETQYGRNLRKKQILLKKEFTTDEGKEWKDRSLNDTKYISRFMLNLINDRLEFKILPKDKENKKRVTAVNGVITSYVRKNWGVEKIREDGDKHHAVDAAVIAVITEGVIQKITRHAKRKELKYIKSGDYAGKYTDTETGEIDTYDELMKLPERLQDPCGRDGKGTTFADELMLRIGDKCGDACYEEIYRKMGYIGEQIANVKPVFVSRMPTRKVKGQIHKETVSSARTLPDGKEIAVKKVALKSLKFDENGDINNYYDRNSDPLLYNALKNHIIEWRGKNGAGDKKESEKAFKDTFYKPKSDGTPGNPVRAVKIYETAEAGKGVILSKVGRDANGKVGKYKAYAANGEMIRADIFVKKSKKGEERFYAVPVYTKDFGKELPMRAVAANKPYAEWSVMDEKDGYMFLFSLYPNDLFEAEHKSGISMTKNDDTKKPLTAEGTQILYYRGLHSANGSIAGFNHDHSFNFSGLGITTLKSFKKLEVDIIGNVHEVKSEKRLPLGKIKTEEDD